MLKTLTLVLSLLISTSGYSQYMLCQTTFQQEVYLVRYQDREILKLNMPSGKLAGYKLKSDSLLVFLNKGYGHISSYGFTPEWLKQRSVRKEANYSIGYIEHLYKEKEVILHEDSTDLKNKWKVKLIPVAPDLKLAVDDCYNLTMFRNGKQLWTYTGNRDFMGLSCYTDNGNAAESVHLAATKILFVRIKDTMLGPKTYRVVEIAKETGEAKTIARSRHRIEASYSPDEKYIYYNLLSKNGFANTFQYNRETGKREIMKLQTGKYTSQVESMYWIN